MKKHIKNSHSIKRDRRKYQIWLRLYLREINIRKILKMCDTIPQKNPNAFHFYDITYTLRVGIYNLLTYQIFILHFSVSCLNPIKILYN